ncbi:hypothetical protein ACU8V7_27600 [Zobellia nedashkovskayae]
MEGGRSVRLQFLQGILDGDNQIQLMYLLQIDLRMIYQIQDVTVTDSETTITSML